MRDSPLTPLTCPICPETFQRAEHLKRHALTHNDDKPYVCPYCNLQYKRSDALRRHWKTCAARISAGHEIPGRCLSGKRKQACDSCTSRKRACSRGVPCDECAMRGVECTYHCVEKVRESVHGGEHRLHRETEALGSDATVDESGLPIAGKKGPRFGFLANFTRARSLDEAYSYTSKLYSSAVCHSCPGESALHGRYDHLNGNSASSPSDPYLYEFESALGSDFTTSDTTSKFCATGDIPEADLKEKARQIHDALEPILRSTRMNQATPSSMAQITFFSPKNILRYLHLFWTRWYCHCPIVHQATFNPTTCSPLLLVTMSLIGACMSPSDADHQSAKTFLDPVEELIFSNQLFMEFPRLGTKNENLLQTRENIQILQATCFICLLQKWEGTATAKLRMQRHRFTAFVATTRAMGLSQAVHPRIDLTSTPTAEEWKKYILKAEMIRTFNHVFLLDSAFVIFHNSVPRMVLQEMTIDLTCPEDTFQARSPEAFVKALRAHYSEYSTQPLLTDCVRNLCVEKPNPDVIRCLHGQSALNLFTIATAVHGLIFHQLRAFSPLPLVTSPLKRALDRWEEAWNDSMSTRDPIEINGVLPFPFHAGEFAALARVHIEKCHLAPEEWHAMLEKLPENISIEDEESLATFDQTGMDQVANLLLAVEHLDLK